jgi:hypothetical protein
MTPLQEETSLQRPLRRAAIALAAIAVGWMAILLLGAGTAEDRVAWLIPIGAAALSLLCFHQSAGPSSRPDPSSLPPGGVPEETTHD